MSSKPRGDAGDLGPGLGKVAHGVRRSEGAGQVGARRVRGEVLDQLMDGPGMLHDAEHEPPRRRSDRHADHPLAMDDRRQVRPRGVLVRIRLEVGADAEDQVLFGLARGKVTPGDLHVVRDGRRAKDFHDVRCRESGAIRTA